MMDKAATRILVLDDEPFMLDLLSHMLGEQGFANVRCCDEGAAALALLDEAAGAPELILLDINMPGVSGIEFMRAISRAAAGPARWRSSAARTSCCCKPPRSSRARTASRPWRRCASRRRRRPSPRCSPSSRRRGPARARARTRATTPPRCARRSTAASSSTTTSPRSMSRAARSSASRRWCAGSTRRTGSCFRTSSSRWRRRTASSKA